MIIYKKEQVIFIMQIKKQEVYNAILKNAEIEFFNYGFEKASIRNIVKASGTTIGNFYNYFESKEALFDVIVKDEYNKFTYIINNHDNIDKPDYLWDISNPSVWRDHLSQFIMDFIPKLNVRFVILIECSKGTQYEASKKQLVNLIKEHFEEHVKNFGNQRTDFEIGEFLAEQLINGIISILKTHKDNAQRKKQLISEYLLFYFIGVMGFIGEF